MARGAYARFQQERAQIESRFLGLQARSERATDRGALHRRKHTGHQCTLVAAAELYRNALERVEQMAEVQDQLEQFLEGIEPRVLAITQMK